MGNPLSPRKVNVTLTSRFTCKPFPSISPQYPNEDAFRYMERVANTFRDWMTDAITIEVGVLESGDGGRFTGDADDLPKTTGD